MILVIDNYDSFTFNLVQLIGELGAEVEVRRNDAVDPDAIAALNPSAIVISPGPCTPAEAGVSVSCVRHFAGRVPILGVCLGHQSIGAAFGARIVRARRVMHGKVSPVKHRGVGLFEGVPAPFEAARYHSLVIDPPSLPRELEVIAWTDEPGFDDEIQAVRHVAHPVWGVQFHPESIATPAGRTIMTNFLSLS